MGKIGCSNEPITLVPREIELIRLSIDFFISLSTSTPRGMYSSPAGASRASLAEPLPAAIDGNVGPTTPG